MTMLFAQGFVALRTAPVALPEHFVDVGSLDGYTIFQDRRVPSARFSSADMDAMLLGFAGHLAEDVSPQDAIANAFDSGGLSGIAEALGEIVGRWVLLVRPATGGLHVFHDAIGTRSVFYSTDGEAIASHVDLIMTVHGRVADAGASRRPVSQMYAFDLTEVDHIRALLPNFRLDLPGAHAVRIYPLARNPNEHLSLEELLSKIERLWRAGNRWALSLPYRQVASLTAGFDSRLMAAMHQGQRSEIEYFTYRMAGGKDEDDFSARTWNRDARTAAAIAEKAGLNHRIIEFSRKPSSRPEVRDVLLRNSPLAHGVAIAERYLEEFGELGAVLHRGSGLEIGREYYASNAFTGSPVDEGRRLCGIEFGKAPEASERPESTAQLVDRYMDEMGLAEASAYGYSIPSLVYWEYRCGRFQSDILTGLDAAFVPVNGFSSRALWDAILAIPVELRRANWLYFALLGRAMPELNSIPVNGVDHFARFMDEALGIDTSDRGVRHRPSAWRAAVKFFSGTGESEKAPLLSSRPDVFFVPETRLTKGGWAACESTIQSEAGALALAFRSPYSLGAPSRCLELQLLVDGEVFVREDIGYSAEIIHVHIEGVTGGMRVQLRVAALQDLPKSWEAASRVEVLNWEERPRKVSSSRDLAIGWSSPWAQYDERAA